MAEFRRPRVGGSSGSAARRSTTTERAGGPRARLANARASLRGDVATARESLRAAAQATPGGVSAPQPAALADLVSLSPEDLLAEVRLLSGPTNEPLLELRAVRDRLRNLALDVGNGTSRIDAEALRAEWSRAIHDAVSQGVKEVVGEVNLQAQLDAGAQRDWAFVWLAVGDDGTCAPCDERHGQEQTLDEWERDGMPRAPRGVCLGSGRCRCELVPIRPANEG